MSVIDVANGFRGSKGTTTLSLSDTAELEELLNNSGATIEVERMRSGGCIVNCEDLCRVLFGEEEEEMRRTRELAGPKVANANDIVAKVALGGPRQTGRSGRRGSRMTERAAGRILDHESPSAYTNPPGPPSNPGLLAAQDEGRVFQPISGGGEELEDEVDVRERHQREDADRERREREANAPPLPGNDPKQLEKEGDLETGKTSGGLGTTSGGKPTPGGHGASVGPGGTGNTQSPGPSLQTQPTPPSSAADKSAKNQGKKS